MSYELLRKPNDSLNSLIGKSYNEKSKFEAEKILKEIHSKAQDRSIDKKALCFIYDKGEIKGVGGSTLMKDKKTGEIKSNLILDQFGQWLSVIFSLDSATDPRVNVKDRTGVIRNMFIYSFSGTALFNQRASSTRGFFVQVGSGITVPARTDFNINTPFGTAPESGNFVAVSNPVWNSGLGNFKYGALITAGGAGTINESICGSRWQISVGTNFQFIHFRDIISPAQSFILGQSIALEYTIQL